MAKKSTSKRRRKRGRKRRSLFYRVPAWGWWLIGAGTAVVYVFVFYHFFVSPLSFRWKALYGETKYPDGYSIQGIDISHYQGEVDWDKLCNAQIKGGSVSFVIIKATEGMSLLDENFNDNFFQAKEHDFIRGAYHYFTPSAPADRQARYFLKQVHLEDGDLPPVLDVEERGSLTPAQLKKAVLTWLEIVEKKYGVKPVIYASYHFKTHYLNDSIFNTYPYWIAHYYVDEIAYKGAWKFWQYTDNGRLSGIKGAVDFNIYNGSMYDLRKFTIGGKEEYER